jgi:hypothetical protein
MGPKATSFTEAADTADQTRECLRRGTTETTCQLRRWKRVLDGDPEQPGVLDRELTKDRNAGLDQIRGRVISAGERRHARSECVECARAKGNQEAFLGIVNAIHGARTRPYPPGHGPYGQGGGTTLVQDCFRRVQERERGQRAVLSTPTHLDSIALRCYVTL